MVVINVYEGFTSEIRAFFLAYRLSEVLGCKFVLDVSQFYQGSFWAYHLDNLMIGSVEKYMSRNASLEGRVSAIRAHYKKEIIIVTNGEELEEIYNNYDDNFIYYISEDSYMYDYFFEMHNEYFYRYIGNDSITNKLYSQIELKSYSSSFLELYDEIEKNNNSVGVHIRLGDFYNVGWIVDSDLLFYTASIQLLREKLDAPVFYVFSDDQIKAKELLGDAKDIRYIHFDYTPQSDVEELYCLARCHHRILNKKSTYGLLSEAIAQNKFKTDGNTLIIKKMNFSETAGNKEYVEKAVNTNSGINRDSFLGTYLELGIQEINEYNQKFQFAKNEINQRKLHEIDECENGETVLFLTRQVYSTAKPVGMELWAHLLARKGVDVCFVGDNGETARDDVDSVFETSHIEYGMSNIRSKIRVFQYKSLNKYDLYTSFVDRVAQKNNRRNVKVICRKPNAMPSVDNHNGVEYIFIDFTDPYEIEARKCIEEYSEEQIDYMYKNADLIVTFSQDVKEKYRNLNVIYINIGDLYSDYRVLNGNYDSFEIEKGFIHYCECLSETILMS